MVPVTRRCQEVAATLNQKQNHLGQIPVCFDSCTTCTTDWEQIECTGQHLLAACGLLPRN
jgi:hypothetical protein